MHARRVLARNRGDNTAAEAPTFGERFVNRLSDATGERPLSSAIGLLSQVAILQWLVVCSRVSGVS